jgi:hypothetical protein
MLHIYAIYIELLLRSVLAREHTTCATVPVALCARASAQAQVIHHTVHQPPGGQPSRPPAAREPSRAPDFRVVDLEGGVGGGGERGGRAREGGFHWEAFIDTCRWMLQGVVLWIHYLIIMVYGQLALETAPVVHVDVLISRRIRNLLALSSLARALRRP